MIQERSFFFQIVATTTNCDVKDTNYKRGKRELFGQPSYPNVGLHEDAIPS